MVVTKYMNLRNVDVWWNGLEHHHLYIAYYPSICLEELKKSSKILSADGPSAGSEPAEYKAGILTIRPPPLVAAMRYA